MTLTPYPTLRLKLTLPQALKLRFLPAIPGTNAANAAEEASAAAAAAIAAAAAAVAATAGKVDKAGDTMTGALTLSADPIANLHAATKQYVDGTIGGGGEVNTSGVVVATQLAGFADTTGTLIRGVTVGAGLDMSAGTTLNLDSDLSAIAALTDVGTIFYRSSDGVWDPVVIGDNLTFTAGELSATGGGSGGAPVTAEYVTAATSSSLTAERVLTDTVGATGIAWDFSTPGQAKATTVGSAGAPTTAEYITSATNSTLTAERVLTDTSSITWDFATTAQAKASTTLLPHEGRLTYVSTTALLFSPYAGNKIKINGTIYTIPTAGIAGTANTSVFVNGTGSSNLAASTVYWIYAFINSSTVTADFRSASTHATSSTSGNEGVEIRTGDDTRTLIGLCRTNASSQFVDSVTQRFVRSWFNGGAKQLRNNFTTDRQTTSTTHVELNSEIRCEFVSWAGEVIEANTTGMCNDSSASVRISTSIGFNGATAEGGTGLTAVTASTGVPAAHYCNKTGLTEGYNWATALGAVSAGTGTWFIAATVPDAPVNLHVTLLGLT